MPRVAPGNFTRTPRGEVVFSDGLQNVRRWDGLASAFSDAGVPAPTTKPTLAEGGTGTISGTIFGIVRYLDADGNVSNVSPLSDSLTIDANTAAITDATHATPIVVTSTGHGLSDGDTVRISGVLGNAAANGTWVIDNKTANTFELVGSVGSGTYAGGGNWYQGAGSIVYTNLPVPTDSRVTRKQVFRSKDGAAAVFYLDLDTDVDVGFDTSDTTFTSTNADSALGTELALLDANGNDLNQSRHSEPPNWKPVYLSHQGRMWALGDGKYHEGAVAVSNGSATVTGIGTAWTSAMDGWQLYVRGATEVYTVDSISGQTITLSENYGGTTDPFAYYELRKGGDERRTIYAGEVDGDYKFDLQKGLTLPEDPEAGEITGGISYRGFLYLLFEGRMYRFVFSGEPSEDGQAFKDHFRGCLNQRCWAIADNLAYLMDRRGIYAFGGNYDESISEPIQPLFEPESDAPFHIRFEFQENFHCCHDPAEGTIRWFVCMSGSRYPRHSLCYHYRSQRWWVEEWPFGITGSCLGTINGRQQVFLGTTARRVLALGRGSLDGVTPNDGTVRGTATAADVMSLTDSSAAFSANVVGYPVRIVSGTGKGQQRIISARTATKLTVSQPWIIKPSTDSVYQVGGFQWKYRTGWFTLTQTESEEKRSIAIRFKPTTAASRMEYRLYSDDPASTLSTALTNAVDFDNNGLTGTADEAERVVDTTKASGYVREQRDGPPGNPESDQAREWQLELEGCPNEERQRIREITIEGAAG